MCDSPGSICDRRRAADCAGAECNVSRNNAGHNVAPTYLVDRTDFIADSQSDSAARRGPGLNTGSTGAYSRRASSARNAWCFTRNTARHNASHERRPGSGLYTSGLR